jgi:hypothetical protein
MSKTLAELLTEQLAETIYQYGDGSNSRSGQIGAVTPT